MNRYTEKLDAFKTIYGKGPSVSLSMIFHEYGSKDEFRLWNLFVYGPNNGQAYPLYWGDAHFILLASFLSHMSDDDINEMIKV